MWEPNVDASPDPGDPLRIDRLTRRADFVRVGKGRRWHAGAMTVQALARDPDPGPDDQNFGDRPVRIGFTLTRKVGCAVIRNRARRRLREAVRLAADLPVRPGHDYVIVGRIDAIRLPFAALQRELDRAIRGVHDARGPRSRAQRTKPAALKPAP